MNEMPINVGDMLTIITILGSTAMAVWRISKVINRFESRLLDLEKDRYPMSIASENALRLAILNPGIQIPDPRDPNRTIVVNHVRVSEPAKAGT
jgi:hypothetical protein